ncbi:MAG: hypothetical protein A3J07_02605 [Candidatus Doudnabacteria bacterium RIFCSPLOWO2_02_FULL_49_13]|uniref:acylphosphatase n=1 Tax=Candidatus Doudnabacteria bacterium RIFCSPHIGHO2_12_FULL_48_16 TaxID=1817838 RepID=A0A1F5PL27_9BACT|nr:MAG: hypothetical protein A3B77_01255 [Candidatus Doudnabacteria bacterium RIFCSPHIGHO2_02_FULL_49_24]OGE89088.1 MAG: hypothetical protein A2760_02965 [Candidatus Doudnabacteria bacterium RIFCSPHIGHO2_01_FULL_50_67]OGE90569.1 MAG: hypothetical protein A3E29_02120 [Candidatus Doudnabacteria bacterium RIFCSPHIGHO2_12_FULL_48_16]OGE97606.1 MAG: hypothetical protein A2990_03175 [Candidatus Doudnabacteria bacterium RIFCSPLOWO2_01_FULL_49_40]OGF02961.1 MAG: hypothetical protein A3J07_02605 [Candid
MKHVNLKIVGFVQGVNFRNEAKIMADRLGVCGFAQNGPDDSVLIEAEGDEARLQEFIKWCGNGPFGGEVDDVQIEESAPKGYHNFEIRYH